MGKRRLRCLQQLGYTDIVGYDPRADRRAETERLYGCKTVEDPDALDYGSRDALIVSTPPDQHVQWARRGLEHGLATFIEASVVLDGLEELGTEASRRGVLMAPSCTLRFHPAIKTISSLVRGGKYGRAANFSYHSGQYLPDWHPWESISDFYVSKKATGAAREIVPFELTWLVDLFGFPTAAVGFRGDQIHLGVDIDDTYVLALRFPEVLGTLLVDVVSRYATRHLILNLDEGQIVWRWDEAKVRVYSAATGKWHAVRQNVPVAAPGYNANIGEEMYVRELEAFISAAQGRGHYPHTLHDDVRVLGTLYAVEAGDDACRSRGGEGRACG